MPNNTYRVTITVDVEMTNADANRLEMFLVDSVLDFLGSGAYREYVRDMDSWVDIVKPDDSGPTS